jgi:hypothetical protein
MGTERTGGRRQLRRMGTMARTIRDGGSRGRAPSVLADLAEFAQSLARSLFDPYRPELYYMRGPGPKWHAKHDAMPALVRVRAKR